MHLGDFMFDLNEIVVTEISKPFTVVSPKGKVFQQTSRKNCGLSFCMDGKIEYLSKGKRIVSDEKNIVFLPKGAGYTLIGAADGRFPLINFECNGDVGDEVLAFSLADKASCIRQFEKIKDLFLLQGSKHEIYAAFYELLQLICSERKPSAGKLARAVSYIEEHLFEYELSNSSIAEYLGISEVYLRKLFRQEFRTTPKQYVLGLRLAKAKKLLCQSDFSVTRISEECGFSCVYHFCRAFKSKVGCTPREFAAADRATDENVFGI